MPRARSPMAACEHDNQQKQSALHRKRYHCSWHDSSQGVPELAFQLDDLSQLQQPGKTGGQRISPVLDESAVVTSLEHAVTSLEHAETGGCRRSAHLGTTSTGSHSGTGFRA
eukprot:198577-Prymnesium_polylepis.1